MNNILELVDVRRKFVQGDVTIEVLRGVDLVVGKGELVALLGPSGSGKSTMLQAVGLLEGGFSGSIKLDGEEVSAASVDRQTEIRRQKLGFVYQFHHLLPDFDALENVILPQLISDAAPDVAHDRATYLLTQLGLAERLHHRPSKLSGGEQQRVAVARALANRPKLVLADEPTGNLDEHTANIVLGEFMALVREEGSSAIVATHNERLAAKMDRIVRLHDGKLNAARE
jgi:lipoprotein-releasing system ATP-binding protein